MQVPAGGAFNPSLHPRAAGGKFGQANNPKQQAAGRDTQLKGQLESRAKQFRQEAARCSLQIAEKRAQIQSLQGSHSTRSHSTAKKSSTAKAKGSKSGISKKTTTTSKTRSKTASAPSTVNAKEIGKLTYQIHGLQQQREQFLKRASALDAQARRL